jgi:hypothetical protein
MQVKFIHEAFCRLRPGIILSALHGKVKQEKRLQVPPPRRTHLPLGHLRGGRGQALLSSLDAFCDVIAAPRAGTIFSDFCVSKP